MYVARRQVLNLFLALLLNAFATDGLKSDTKNEKEDSKMTRGWHMLKRLFKKKKPVRAVSPSKAQSVCYS